MARTDYQVHCQCPRPLGLSILLLRRHVAGSADIFGSHSREGSSRTGIQWGHKGQSSLPVVLWPKMSVMLELRNPAFGPLLFVVSEAITRSVLMEGLRGERGGYKKWPHCLEMNCLGQLPLYPMNVWNLTFMYCVRADLCVFCKAAVSVFYCFCNDFSQNWWLQQHGLLSYSSLGQKASTALTLAFLVQSRTGICDLAIHVSWPMAPLSLKPATSLHFHIQSPSDVSSASFFHFQAPLWSP